jgi:GNAT superfamily N-acetyltransferase
MKAVKLKRPRADFDAYWKAVLDRYLQQCLELFYPEAAADIDWSKGYSFLDKELQRIGRGSKQGKRLVDKLIKLYRKSGDEQTVLIHMELQGQKEDDFNKRMFRYYIRLWDYYEKPIASLAILADTTPNWRPNSYSQELWGCKAGLSFKTVKILDFQPLPYVLEKKPLGIIINAYFSPLKTQKDNNQRYDIKLQLTKSLYQQGLDKDTILELYCFIDMALALPEGLEVKYTQTIEEYEEKMNMPYITSAERIGIQKGEAAVLSRQLQHKFQSLPEAYQTRLASADTETLLEWSERVLEAETIEDVFGDTDN